MRARTSILFSLAGGLITLSILSMTGCASSPSQVDSDTRAAIGDAATARYPGPATPASANGSSAAPTPGASPAAGSIMATAVDHPRSQELEVFNLADTAIPDATVWVNGAYVRRVGTIPPRGSVTIRYSILLQAGQPANDFRTLKQPITKVEIQTATGLYPASGPAVKS